MLPRWRPLALAAVAAFAGGSGYADDKDGWKSIFDGKTLEGWHITGAEWKAENGAIVATIGDDRKDGYLQTNERYGDFEIELEFKVDWPVDSGVFLRNTDEGQAYQVTLDNREKGHIAAIYTGGLPGGRVKPYLYEPEGPRKGFKKDDWNKLSARIEGKAPHFVVNLNDETVVDVTDPEARHQADGPVGLQVHGGNVWQKGKFAWFRNIRIRPVLSKQADAAPKSVTLAVTGMT